MTVDWLTHYVIYLVQEIANVFKRAKIPFHQITVMFKKVCISIFGFVENTLHFKFTFEERVE